MALPGAMLLPEDMLPEEVGLDMPLPAAGLDISSDGFMLLEVADMPLPDVVLDEPLLMPLLIEPLPIEPLLMEDCAKAAVPARVKAQRAAAKKRDI